jgi:hypothetical protein
LSSVGPIWADQLAVLVAATMKATRQKLGSEAADGLARRLAALDAENQSLHTAMGQLSDAALAVEAARDTAVARVDALRGVLTEILSSPSLADELRRMIRMQALPILEAQTAAIASSDTATAGITLPEATPAHAAPHHIA